jgi:phage shock protein C
MYCTKCGVELEDSDRFCSTCGAGTINVVKNPWPNNRPKRLMRSARDKKIAGVCGGLGEYLGIDSTLIRIVFLIFLFTPPIIFFPYLIAWIVMPKEPEVPVQTGVTYSTQQQS